MIGGIVTDVWIWESDQISVVVEGTGCERGKYLEQRVEKNDYSLGIIRGDSLWWQMGHAYWTPKDKSVRDVKIIRFGLSVPVPDGMTRKRAAFLGDEHAY